MSDKMKVYSKVVGTLKKMIPVATQNDSVVLAMMITGIIMGKKAQLSEMSLHVPHRAKPASLAKRFQRFVKNERIEVTNYFMPFAQEIVRRLADKPIHLVMDASQVGRGCMVLMVGVVYKQRAIPLAWLVYKGKKGHTTAERHIAALELVLPLIPETAQVILLGDAEYDTVKMLTWVKHMTNWQFVVRTEPRILLTKDDKTYPIRDILAGYDSRTLMTEVLFTKQTFGPVSVVAWWQPPYQHPLYLVSSLTDADLICRSYALRFKLETLFSDKKGRGFHIDKSHLSDPDRIARLLLAASLAYTWLVYLGVCVKGDEARRSIVDRPNRTDKSLFRLGFDWLKYALTHGLDFKVFFLPPSLSHSTVR